MTHTSTYIPGRFADVLLDGWLNKFFGQGKEELLTLMLEALIPERKISRLQVDSGEHTNPFTGKKCSRLDVECTDEDGTRFLVELQVADQEFFYDRVLYYSAYGLLQQIERGADYYYPKIYSISLMKFSRHPDTDQVLFRYSLRAADNPSDIMSDKLQFIFLETTNCKRSASDAVSLLDKLCDSFLNMKRYTERPKNYNEKVLQALYNSAELSNFAPDELKNYINTMTTEQDRIAQLQFAEKTGTLANFRV